MTISNESKAFFIKLSKIWQNFKDYSYLEGINLSAEQINIIENDEDQLLIEGYAGTGKSLTLLYKFINVLIREESKRILFVTYNSTLIEDTKKRLLTSKEYCENVHKHKAYIMTFHEMATDILKKIKVIERGIGKITIEKQKKYEDTAFRRIAPLWAEYTESISLPKEEKLYKTHTIKFIVEEIAWIKAMGLINLDRYLMTERTGRSKSIRLTRSQRKTIFKIYERYQKDIDSKKYGESLDLEDYALKIIYNKHLISDEYKFDYIFVDEVQDLDPMQIMALCQLTKKSIVLSGDAKQRIYKKSPIKYEDLGLNIKEKGKRKILNKNYRSTEQIITLANSLKFSDSEGKFSEKQFVKQGDRPIIHATKTRTLAAKYLVNSIKEIFNKYPEKSIAIVHREEIKEKKDYKSDLRKYIEKELMISISDISNYSKKFNYNKEKQVFYTNVYDVKGLEFDYVFIVDFNKKYYPNEEEIKKIKESNEGKDEQLINEDILEFINREKKLLYVAMTRAKEKLFLIADGNNGKMRISNFIYDFSNKDYEASGFTKKSIEDSKERYEEYIKSISNQI